MATVEEQLAEVYATIDKLQALELELRAGVDRAVANLKGEQNDND